MRQSEVCTLYIFLLICSTVYIEIFWLTRHTSLLLSVSVPPSLKSTSKQLAATSAAATTPAEISSSLPPPFVQSKPPPSPPAPSPLMLPEPDPVQVEVTAAAEVDAHQEEEDGKEEEIKRDKPDSEVSHVYFASTLNAFFGHLYCCGLCVPYTSATMLCDGVICVEPISAQ